MRLTRLLSAIALLAAVARPAVAQGGGSVLGRSILRGTVIDDADDRPISGATVAIETLRLSVVTDSTGIFRMPGLPAGRHLVVVRRLGYTPLSAVLNVGRADTAEYDFALIRQATSLPEVEVKTAKPVPPKLAEFEARRLEGFGRFLTPDVLEKNRDRRMSEVIAMLPGPRIVRGWGSNGWVASSVGASSIERHFKPTSADLARGADPKQCYAAVMLDGNLVFSGRNGEMLFDVNTLGTESIAAIEYYRDAASVPMKFNVRGEETCGLVVIWTK